MVTTSEELPFVGELVIEWPDAKGEYRNLVPGKLIALYEFRIGFGLKLLTNVVALELHADGDSFVTADLTRSTPTSDPDEPYVREVSRWHVIGFRLESDAPR